MEIVVDLSYWIDLLNEPPWVIFWGFFTHGGWVFILAAFLWGIFKAFVYSQQLKFGAKRRFALLAIDIPKGNEQTPKAVENIFSQLAGAHSSFNLVQKYFKGRTQDVFSLEIVSIEGYTQFLIRTNTRFRDLVEAAIYAQYPDAEIAEVADYTEGMPNKFPDEVYDLWGTEMIYPKHKSQYYPLRTYPKFEHVLSGEFKDPLNSLLECMSRLGPGEQLWFQIIITPINDKWREKGYQLVKKLIGAKSESKKGIISGIASEFGKALTLPPSPTAAKAPKREEPPSKMLYLSPGERKIVEGVEEKISKIGFKTKIRVVYIGRKEVFQKEKGAHTMIGAIKQFNTVDLGSLKPELKKVGVTAHYYLTKWRKNRKRTKIIRAYKGRSNTKGAGDGYVLNIEELATLYHFPEGIIKTPLLKKTEAKRGQPPFRLPAESYFTEESKKEKEEAPPGNLPVE